MELTKVDIAEQPIFYILLNIGGITSAASLLVNPVTAVPSISIIVEVNYEYKKIEEWV